MTHSKCPRRILRRKARRHPIRPIATEPLERRIMLTTVTAVNPPGGSHAAAVWTEISATFDQAVAPATEQTFVVHSSQRGKLVGAATTVATSGSTARHTPAAPFQAGELVEATVTSGLASVGGPHVWQFRAATAAGSGTFSDSGQILGIPANNTRSFALALGDVDGDGDLDIFVANASQGSRVYLNNGSADFTDSGQSLGNSASRDVALGDLDGDGDLDAVIANTNSQPNRVWQNDGSGVFSETRTLGGNSSQDVKLGDLDGDGDLDAFFGNTGANRVWLNNGGILSDSGQALGDHTTLGVGLGDLDGDGDLDAFTGNTRAHADRIWINDGGGRFSDSGQGLGNPAIKSSRDVAIGDVDNDGDLDAFVVGRGYNNILFLNDGGGTFTDSGQVIDAPVNPFFEYGASMGDIDADGDLDIVTSAEAIAHWNRVWVNDGDGVFNESGQNLGGGAPYATNAMASFGIELGDLDGDGDLDVAIANDNTSAVINSTARVWLNQNPTPSVSLAADSSSIAEAAGTATISATLTQVHGQPVTIELASSGAATAGDDYTLSGTQIVIAAGDTTGSVTLTALQDSLDEPDETVVVDIASVANGLEAGTQRVTVTIVDDDEPIPVPDVTLSVDNSVIPEAGGAATFTANLSVTTSVPVTVDLGFSGTATTDDYSVSSSQIVIAPGAASGSVTVTSTQDAIDEPDETVVVDILGVIGAVELAAQLAVTTITDDDPSTLSVTAMTPTVSGFTVEFASDLMTSQLNLYDTENLGLGEADVVLQGTANGAVAGSLVIDSPRQVTFIKSGGPLEADEYTLTLRSGTDSFVDVDGQLLDGNQDGTEGDDYSGTFSVGEAVAGEIVLSLPDFVRGPGQNVNLPAPASGIPVTISDGTDVRAIDMRVRYDPALLTIDGATVGPGVPAGATVIVNATTPGLAIVVFFSSTALPAEEIVFVNLQASVPATDPSLVYGTQQVLDIHGVTISDGNDNEAQVVVDDAFHLASYFADVSGNGRINASDAAQVARFAALIDGGFAGSINADPIVVGDPSGNGRVNAADASLVAQFAALIEVPQIPAVPAGIQVAGIRQGPPATIQNSVSAADEERAEDESGSSFLLVSNFSSAERADAVDRVIAEVEASSSTLDEILDLEQLFSS